MCLCVHSLCASRFSCDPHAGNILVTRRSATDSRPRLVLLDHGLYKELDDPFRLSYAHLWQSLIRGDHAGIMKYSAEMNAGAMYSLFASMLTRKSYTDITNTVKSENMSNLTIKNDESERRRIQQWALQHAEDVQAILAKIPKPLLLLLKTNDCLRAIDTQLGTPVNSFLIMSAYCTRAISEDQLRRYPNSWRVWLDSKWDIISMDLRVRFYALILAFLRVMNSFKRLVHPVKRFEPEIEGAFAEPASAVVVAPVAVATVAA